MADAEARREARRRKILQNSENRLNKLLGSVSTEHAESSETDIICPPGKKADVSTPFKSEDVGRLKPDVFASASNASSAAASADIDESFQDGRMETENSFVRQRAQHSGSSGDDSFPSVRQFNDPVSSPSQFSSSGEGDIRRRDASTSDPVIVLDHMRCGGCLLTAFITRWALNFGIGLLFFEMALVPFILLEGAMYMFQTTHLKDVQLPHQNTMITYALVLSGMKPEIITKYNKTMGYFAALTEDFALYLFSFIIFGMVVG